MTEEGGSTALFSINELPGVRVSRSFCRVGQYALHVWRCVQIVCPSFFRSRRHPIFHICTYPNLSAGFASDDRREEILLCYLWAAPAMSEVLPFALSMRSGRAAYCLYCIFAAFCLAHPIPPRRLCWRNKRYGPVLSLLAALAPSM